MPSSARHLTMMLAANLVQLISFSAVGTLGKSKQNSPPATRQRRTISDLLSPSVGIMPSSARHLTMMLAANLVQPMPSSAVGPLGKRKQNLPLATRRRVTSSGNLSLSAGRPLSLAPRRTMMLETLQARSTPSYAVVGPGSSDPSKLPATRRRVTSSDNPLRSVGITPSSEL